MQQFSDRNKNNDASSLKISWLKTVFVIKISNDEEIKTAAVSIMVSWNPTMKSINKKRDLSKFCSASHGVGITII